MDAQRMQVELQQKAAAEMQLKQFSDFAQQLKQSFPKQKKWGSLFDQKGVLEIRDGRGKRWEKEDAILKLFKEVAKEEQKIKNGKGNYTLDEAKARIAPFLKDAIIASRKAQNFYSLGTSRVAENLTKFGENQEMFVRKKR